MKKMQTKILLITGLIAPYRFPVFEKLSKLYKFKVWFMGKEVKNRIWGIRDTHNYKFKYKILSGITLNFGIRDNFPFWMNFRAPFLLAKAKPDVVIMFGWDSLTSFLINFTRKFFGNTKFILFSDSTAYEKSWRRFITYPLVRLHVKQADACIAGGTRAMDYLKQLGGDSSKIFLSPNCNDVDKYKVLCKRFKRDGEFTKSELGLIGKRIIMFYGQLIERKGPDLLIQAFEKIKSETSDTALLIVGSGKFKDKLEEIIANKKIKDVRILDDPGDDEVCKYYAVSDLFVLPSRQDVWGLVVNEAMSCGLPVVVSDVCGSSADLVQNGINGYTFESGNIDSLYLKIKKILIDRKLQQKFGENSLKIIENFKPKTTFKGFTDAINYVQQK